METIFDKCLVGTTITILVVFWGVVIYCVSQGPTPVNEPVINSNLTPQIPYTPLTQSEIDILTHIYKDQPEISSYLSGYQAIFDRRNDLANSLKAGGMNTDLVYDKILEFLSQTTEWKQVVIYLMSNPPRQELLDAINQNLISAEPYIPSPPAIDLNPIDLDPINYEHILEGRTDLVTETIARIPRITGSNQTAVSSNPDIFYDFITSEFGMKCIVVGSVVTITAIIIHMVVVYYYKTTYTALAYKFINFISSLFKF